MPFVVMLPSIQRQQQQPMDNYEATSMIAVFNTLEYSYTSYTDFFDKGANSVRRQALHERIFISWRMQSISHLHVLRQLCA